MPYRLAIPLYCPLCVYPGLRLAMAALDKDELSFALINFFAIKNHVINITIHNFTSLFNFYLKFVYFRPQQTFTDRTALVTCIQHGRPKISKRENSTTDAVTRTIQLLRTIVQMVRQGLTRSLNHSASMELLARVELATLSLPRIRSTY